LEIRWWRDGVGFSTTGNRFAVLDSLQLKSPILIGHSFGGEELSSIGSRRPERIAGLVYLDAGYRYALSGPGLGHFQLDLLTMRKRLAVAMDGITPKSVKRPSTLFWLNGLTSRRSSRPPPVY
jgi:pimeloyl-ACP methyl ester carboxylesterase